MTAATLESGASLHSPTSESVRASIDGWPLGLVLVGALALAAELAVAAVLIAADHLVRSSHPPLALRADLPRGVAYTVLPK